MFKAILGKATGAALKITHRGPMVEVRQHDSIKGEQIIMLDKEFIEDLFVMVKTLKEIENNE